MDSPRSSPLAQFGTRTLSSPNDLNEFLSKPRPLCTKFEGVKLFTLPKDTKQKGPVYRLELPSAVKDVRKPEGDTVCMLPSPSASQPSLGPTSPQMPQGSPISMSNKQPKKTSKKKGMARSASLRAHTPQNRSLTHQLRITSTNLDAFHPGFRCRPSTASPMLSAISERQGQASSKKYMVNRISQLRNLEAQMDQKVPPAPAS